LSQKRIYMTVPRGPFGKGGIERQCQYILNVWPTCAPDLPLTPLMTRGDRGHIIWPFVFAGACLRLVYACAVRRDVGVLHLNAAVRASLWRKAILARIARTFGVPIIVHLHGGGFDAEFARMSPRGQRLARWLFREAHLCIVLGQYWADFICKTFDLSPERTLILMNAVPEPPQAHRVVDFAARPQHILFLGEVGERKGVHILVKALGGLRDRRDWRCTIAGNGPLEVYQKQAEDLGVSDRITFLGWQSPQQTSALLASAHLLVLPSFSENLPMAVLEGLAYGLVVISTPVGAIPEVVQDGQNGLLVPVGDADALTTAFNRVLDVPEQARQLGAAAAETFRTQLSLKPYCEKLVQLYRQVMARHG
jgi:glycosyltransferase involved in cell wall biosynthesis